MIKLYHSGIINLEILFLEDILLRKVINIHNIIRLVSNILSFEVSITVEIELFNTLSNKLWR